MSSFVPLNVYPDSDSEGEVDNTQEIQIEEALKLYQRALKLHTDGEWDEAHKAYDALFQSEIFQEEGDEEQVHGRNTTTASSLPLVLYLAYKNHGAFKLDQLKVSGATGVGELDQTVRHALVWFATALGRDAGDSSLWRKAAQLALVIDSSRLARFSLESIVEHQSIGADPSNDVLALVISRNKNPEEYLASIQLRDVLHSICDSSTLSKQSFADLEKKKLNPTFSKYLNPYPWLPLPASEFKKTFADILENVSRKRQLLSVTTRTWPAIGKAILSRLSEDDNRPVDTSSSLQIIMPVFEGEEEESRETSPGEPTPDSSSKSEIAVVDDNEDVTMTDVSAAYQTTASPAGPQRSASATRKRKSTSLGVDVGDAAGRSRLSKRQREKKEADAAAAAAAAATPESKQKIRQETQDEKLFNTAYESFNPLGVSLGTAASLKINPASEGEVEGEKEDQYIKDFKRILQDWDDDKGNVVLYGDGIQSPDEAAQGMAFLDLEANIPSRPVLAGDEGLRKWVNAVNARGICPEQVGFEWLKALCMRDMGGKKGKRASLAASWVRHSWPEILKEVVISIAGNCEQICLRYFKGVEERLREQLEDDKHQFGDEDYAVIEWAETMLEVYLGDLAAIDREKPGSESSSSAEDDLAKQHLTIKIERARRWCYIVGDLMHTRPCDSDNQLPEDQLTLRYLWANAIFTAYTSASREFRLDCFEDLRALLTENKHPPIELPNSAIMPEISASRAEREISKIKTVDFFSSVFAATTDAGGQKDPREVIEILEAVLEPDAVIPYDEEEGRILQEIGRFLEGSSAMFRLHLWEKLKTAYEKIEDQPKILTCLLRCIEVVVGDLRSKAYLDSSEDHRQFVLLRSLRLVEEMLPLVLDLMLNKQNRELGNEGLIDAMRSVGGLLRLLHTYAFWEDAVLNTEVVASDLHSYRLVVVKFREMLVRVWMLMYLFYKEALVRGMVEGVEDKEEMEEKLGAFLKDVHEELGSRHYCKLANHVLLKLMHDELLAFNHRDLDRDLLQCIHCRFHLMLCSDQWYFYEHKTDPELLDRDTAMQLLGFIMELASRKKILQLQKSDIKSGLDKLTEVLGIPRIPGNPRLMHNEAVIEQYLKSPIHPLRLLGSLRGECLLSTIRITGPYAQIAAKGLYFIQGKIALYPARYQKKLGVVKGDDLDTAISHFRYDIICNADRWESWYRLGQAYECQMEEGQTWSADGINLRRGDLVGWERKTLLCYMMALSLAIRSADDSPETRKVISELYTDFGYRVYSAARPPMAMESFWMDGFERHFSGRDGQGMFKAAPHSELTLTHALKMALHLFGNALEDGGDNWKNHYMIGKCMGKLHEQTRSFSPEKILGKYCDAIRYCPDKVSNEHIFEPHHKLVSAACKFVLQGDISPERACAILDTSHFTRRIDHVDNRESFVKYTLEVLKKMRSADKPKWHHRMTNRAARLKYDELNDVAGARQEFSTLFSNKAAQLSIWRPENERPGRHFVFASQYTMFYVDLLEQLDDRATLEVLARRVRRLANGLFKHTDVWSYVFLSYIKVLRRVGEVPEQNEDGVFKNVSYDEFNTYSGRLDIYCNLKETKSPTLDLLREIFELRRLNAGLAKSPMIDDLLADTYAKLYSELVPDILKQLTQETEDRSNPMSIKNFLFSENEPPVAEPSVSTSVSLAVAHSKLDDLPLRGKMTKVTKRELVSKASSLCKVAPQPPKSTTATSSNNNTAPASPKSKTTRRSSPQMEDTAMESPGAIEAGGSDNDGDSDMDMSTMIPSNGATEEP